MVNKWVKDGWHYKKNHPFFITNEYHFFMRMWPTGYAPVCKIVDEWTLKTRYLGDQQLSHKSVTDIDTFMGHYRPLLAALKLKGIRHGDLTTYAIIVRDNRPLLIDFAESRFTNDPRPDKRPEGDEYWLLKSMEEICQISITAAQVPTGTS